MRFLWDALHDSTRCSFYPFSIGLLGDFFNMRELSDSPDLQATAQSVLSLFAVIPPPREYSEPVIRTLLDVVSSSTVGSIFLCLQYFNILSIEISGPFTCTSYNR